MKYIAAAITLLLFTCAPRFTVYVDLNKDLSDHDIVILSEDTVSTSSGDEKKVRYVLKRDIMGLERLFLRRKMK